MVRVMYISNKIDFLEMMLTYSNFWLSGAIAVHSTAFLPNEVLHVALAGDVNCTGSELTLSSCAVSSYENTMTSCSLRNYVQVVCQGIAKCCQFCAVTSDILFAHSYLNPHWKLQRWGTQVGRR